jgi:hypothetical protein
MLQPLQHGDHPQRNRKPTAFSTNQHAIFLLAGKPATLNQTHVQNA